MEKKIFFHNPQGIKLVGLLSGTATEKIVVLNHGFTGDKREWGYFDRLAEFIQAAGYATLRFDQSGCGESDDAVITIAQLLEDVRTSLDYVHELGYQEVALVGHSMGGYISLAHSDDVSVVIGTAPVTTKTQNEWGDRFTPEQRAEVLATGVTTKIRDKGIRKRFAVSKEIIDFRSSLDQGSFLGEVNLPVLLIHGDADRVLPVEDSLHAMQYLPDGSHLEIIKGANHGFDQHWDEVAQLIVNWLDTHF